MIGAVCDRIAKIIAGLRAFSRNSEHDPVEDVMAADIVDETLALCREKFRFSGFELSVQCPEGAALACRSTEISQIILNLLSNAFDAAVDLPRKRASVEVVQTETATVFRVRDSGKGIAKEISERMMEPFFTTKKVGEGTGLGLSISRGLAEGHGGRLYYDEDEVDTCFVLEIPRRLS